MFNALSSWFKKTVVQPISKLVSSWTTPKATTTKATTYKPATVSTATKAKAASYAAAHPTSRAVQQYYATAPKAKATVQPNLLQSLMSWLTPSQPAQLKPGTYEKALDYAYKNPAAPAVQSWARGLPAGQYYPEQTKFAQDTLRYTLATSAAYPTAQSLAESRQATERASAILGKQPTESWNPETKQYEPYNPALGQSYQEGLRKGQEAMGWLQGQPKVELGKYFPADWQASQDIFGKTEKGQSYSVPYKDG
jgi:hypothetical protein